jgi:hypothetical protein
VEREGGGMSKMRTTKLLSLFIAVAMLLSMALPLESYAAAQRCANCGRPVTGTAYPNTGGNSVSSPAPASPSDNTVKPNTQISFNETSNAAIPGLFLQKGVWGEARDKDVLAVLQSVWGVYSDSYESEYILRKGIHTEIKKSTKGYPTTLSDLSAICLSADNRLWAKYIFQFSHELYHYTTGDGKGYVRHQWFEEAIAEMHSIYVLDILADKWESDAPYENWTDYAPAIRDYYDSLLSDDDFGMYGSQLAQFYKDNRDTLEKNPYFAAEDDRRVVNALAPILYKDVFKNNGGAWETLKILHTMGRSENLTFEEYINLWYDKCDQTQKETVKKIAGILEIELI